MERSFKILVVGNTGVGKTTWINRILTGEYINVHTPTRGVAVYHVRYNTTIGSITLIVWECSGAICHRRRIADFYINASGAILMGDISDTDSCNTLSTWMSEINRVIDSPNFVVCANKIDIANCDLTVMEGTKRDVDFCKISVINSENIHKPFLLLARRILNEPMLEFI